MSPDLGAAFALDAWRFLAQFERALRDAAGEDVLSAQRALAQAGECLRGIRVGAEFLGLEAMALHCAEGEQELGRQGGQRAAGAALRWDTLLPVIAALRAGLEELAPARAGSLAPEPAPAVPAAPAIAAAACEAPAEPEEADQPEEPDQPELQAPPPEPAMAQDAVAQEVVPRKVIASEVVAQDAAAPETVSGRRIDVQLLRMGAWVLALPAELVDDVLEPASRRLRLGARDELVLGPDGALPVRRLEAWGVGREAACLLPLHLDTGLCALEADENLGRLELDFWPLPAAQTAVCGVQAAAVFGGAGGMALLLDPDWLGAELLGLAA